MSLFGFSGENAREKVIVLLTMCFALAMVMLDNTVVNVAVPTIQSKLDASISQIQWILDGYVLLFASLLLTGGILGDRYGRKRTFMAGLAIFTFASLMCGLSSSGAELIAFRALQGVGAALLMPGTLSILTVTFPDGERARAIGLWAGVSGLALALGPTLGGWVVENIGWEAVFFINVPVGVTALVVAWFTVRESRSEETRHLDLVGLGLGTAGLFGVVYGLIEANQKGWSDPLIVSALAGGAVLIAAFVLWEHRARHPMMPLSFYRIPAFSAGNLVAFSISLGMFGTFLFMSLYMQSIRGYSALEAGLRFLPLTLMIVVTAPNAGRYAQKHGSRGPMTYGLILAGLGMLGMTQVSATTPYWMIGILFLVMGHGMAATMAPMTAAVMGSVGPRRAGLGSAMTNTSREVGGVFGIALLGTVLFSRLTDTIGPLLRGLGLSPAQQAGVAAASSHGLPQPDQLTALGLTPAQQAGFADAFQTSFMTGFHWACFIAAVVLLSAGVVANRFIPGRAAVAAPAGSSTESSAADELLPEPVPALRSGGDEPA